MKIRSILISACGVYAGFGFINLAASAQDAGTNSGWYKACSENANSKICNVQIQRVASTGQRIASVNLAEISGEVKRKVFQITVPTNRLIPPGVELQIDDKKPSKIPYSFCMPQICAAEVDLSDSLVTTLKAGNELTLITTNDRGQKSPIKISLAGFTEAYDGAPVTKEALEERQRRIAEELDVEAKSSRDKLKEAQEAAKQKSQEAE